MSDLLAKAVAAHGGQERWNRARAIKIAAVSLRAHPEVKRLASGQNDILGDRAKPAENLGRVEVGELAFGSPEAASVQQVHDGLRERELPVLRSKRFGALRVRRKCLPIFLT